MSPYARRYTLRVVQRARQLKEAGWSSPKIAVMLEREMGVRPSPTVIRQWCAGERTELELARDRANHRRKYRRRRPRGVNPRLSEDWKRERMHELLSRGVSLRAIGQVAAVWWGEELNEEQVMHRLGLERGDTARLRRRTAA